MHLLIYIYTYTCDLEAIAENFGIEWRVITKHIREGWYKRRAASWMDVFPRPMKADVEPTPLASTVSYPHTENAIRTKFNLFGQVVICKYLGSLFVLHFNTFFVHRGGAFFYSIGGDVVTHSDDSVGFFFSAFQDSEDIDFRQPTHEDRYVFIMIVITSITIVFIIMSEGG